MNKRALLALMMAVMLLLASACSLIVKDEQVDRETVVLEVAGKSITKGEFNDRLNEELDYMEYLYSMYGMSYDKTDSENIEEMRLALVDEYVEEAAIDSKITEMGIALTDEEKADAEAAAEAEYQSAYDYIKESEFADADLSEEELDAKVTAWLADSNYSKAELLQSEEKELLEEKLYQAVVKDAAVTDEAIQAEYDTRVETDRADYETDPASYGTDLSSGKDIYYVPGGYRYVKHILLKLDEAQETAISDLESQFTAKNEEIALAEEGTDVAALQAEADALAQQIADRTEEAYAALEPKLAEIQEKIAAGEDFDALIAAYGEDPGMQASPAKELGYALCADTTTYVTEFQNAAIALNKVGDVSEPVRTSYGWHILQYASDIQEGPVALEDVRETIQEELLADLQEETYDEALTAWTEATQYKFYQDRLK